MRALFWLLVIVVAIGLALFAVSNREVVSLGLWPLPILIDLPLYLAVLVAVAIGFVIGQSSAWLFAGRWRREVRRRGRRIASLERELTATQAQLPSVDTGPTSVPALRRP
jgi:uncharacterized integral membrane protein